MSARVRGNHVLDQSNPLCANFVYVLLHNYSIEFDQTSVNKNQYIHFEKIEKKTTGLWGSNFGNGGICKPHF